MDVELYSRTLGMHLRHARERAGLSREDVEAKTGGQFTAVAVASYETAARKIIVERFTELAAVYGASARALIPDVPGLTCTIAPCPMCGTRLVAAGR